MIIIFNKGSENIERSGATGKRAAEAGKINKSLTTLGFNKQ